MSDCLTREESEKYMNIKKAAKEMKMTVQGVYNAIYRGTLKHVNVGGKTYTTKDWLYDYCNRRNNKQLSKLNGKPIFNPDEGRFSVQEAAKFLDVPVSRVFHLIYKGFLKSTKFGGYHVIQQAELESYVEKIYAAEEKTA